jgi:hypothetical protein
MEGTESEQRLLCNDCKKSYRYTDPKRPLGLQEVKAPRISRQPAYESGQIVSPMNRPPLPPGDISGTHFCCRLSRPQSHSAAGRIKSMRNPNNPIGNQSRYLPAC